MTEKITLPCGISFGAGTENGLSAHITRKRNTGQASVKPRGSPRLISDPRYADGGARAANSSALMDYFDGVFATKTRDEWMAIFLACGLMFCSIQHISEVKNDPQARGQ